MEEQSPRWAVMVYGREDPVNVTVFGPRAEMLSIQGDAEEFWPIRQAYEGKTKVWASELARRLKATVLEKEVS